MTDETTQWHKALAIDDRKSLINAIVMAVVVASGLGGLAGLLPSNIRLSGIVVIATAVVVFAIYHVGGWITNRVEHHGWFTLDRPM